MITKTISRAKVIHGGMLVSPEDAKFAFLRIYSNGNSPRWESVTDTYALAKALNPLTASRVAHIVR